MGAAMQQRTPKEDAGALLQEACKERSREKEGRVAHGRGMGGERREIEDSTGTQVRQRCKKQRPEAWKEAMPRGRSPSCSPEELTGRAALQP